MSSAHSDSGSYRMLADGTGLSKRGVQDEIRVLSQRRLIDVVRESPTATPVFRLRCHWRDR